jgi:hypothetical protein
MSKGCAARRQMPDQWPRGPDHWRTDMHNPDADATREARPADTRMGFRLSLN